MADKAREAADKELQRMEKHLAEIYSRAGRELEQKAADYLADFLRLEAQHKKDVESGKWTQEEYDEWRKNKLLYGQKWDRLIDYAKKELASVNKTAIDYINGKTTQVFADSYNHLEEVIDNSDVKGYNFELVDAETVKNLYDNGELMLPHKDLDKEKDEAWNAKAINAEILQGILQGDSIPKIAQRMNNVATKNDVAAIRTARTMITAAENSGRQAGMNKAQEDGIEFLKVWIATADERTRESHVALDGTAIPPDEMFVTINDEELEFPGDWRADGCEVYNCRCSLGTIVKGFVKKSAEEDPQEAEEQQEQQIEIEQQDTIQLDENHNESESDKSGYIYINQLTEEEIRGFRIEFGKATYGISRKEVTNALNNCDTLNEVINLLVNPKEREYITNKLFENLGYPLNSSDNTASTHISSESSDNTAFTHIPFELPESAEPTMSQAAYERAKKDIEESTGKQISDERVYEMLESVYRYTQEDYTDILAVAAGPDSSVYKEYYEEYVRNYSEKAIKEIQKDVDNISEFLEKAPKYEGKVYRALGFDILEDGVSGNWSELSNQLKIGGMIESEAFTSWTNNRDVCEDIIEYRTGLYGGEVGEIGVIMEVESKSGVLIQDYSEMQDQCEVLYNKNAKYEVISVSEESRFRGDYEIRRVRVKLKEV